ncbi:MAG TPA: alpha/beta hydrolase [Candidatus Obscuribacterales bacterium]
MSQVCKSRLLGSNLLSLSVISVPPANNQPPAGLIVALHGFGANAQDLASVAPLLNLPNYQFLFPDAPFPNPYVSGGRMWYSFTQPQQSPQQGYQELAQSQQLLRDWLKSLESTTGVPLSRTILSGFSQGGAMTLDVGLNLPLAGLIVLSGYLHPIPESTNRTFPPVLIVHGRQDSMVPLSSAYKTRDTLTTLGVAVQYHEFDMGHEIRPEVLALIQSFVKTNT